MTETTKPDSPPKKERNRSPSFPAIDLKDAIEKARALYKADGLSWTPVNVAAKHWGFSEKSSSGIRTVAALLHFGLVSEDGGGDNRRIRLSETGKVIVLAPADEHSEAINKAIKTAALTPKLYKELWQKFGPKLPSDGTLQYELEKDGNFNRDSIKGFINDFKATMTFAGLKEGDKIGGAEGEPGGGHSGRDDDPPPPSDPKKKMPALQIEAVPYDLTLPLISGGQAILRIPRTMTEEDYTLLTTLLDANLRAMKKALIAKESQPAASEGPQE